MPKKLEHKPRALVTGASRGIGAAIAKKLAADGFPVIVHYRSGEDLAKAVLADIEGAGGEGELVRFDVTDHAESQAAITKLLEDPRPIGVLVNNAGVTADAPFPAMDHAAWSKVIRTSLDGFYNVTQPLTMPMVRLRWGRIIQITSVSGVIGNRGQVNYSAAKAGIIGATKALALELASRQITVNCVAPGMIATEMTQDMPVDRIIEHIPLKRIGAAEEVAAVVSFLMSPGAAYITRQVIGVDGGLS